ALSGCIERILLLQDFGRVDLGILLGSVAEPRLIVAEVPVAAGVVRYSPHGEVADVRNGEAAVDHVEEIVVTQPGAQMAKLRRPRQAAADPDAHALDAVLVPVHPCHRFTPRLAQSVEAVGTVRAT